MPDGELWGHERFDRSLAEHRGLPAAELAERTIAACREFAGGELADDCALVVVKRMPPAIHVGSITGRA